MKKRITSILPVSVLSFLFLTTMLLLLFSLEVLAVRSPYFVSMNVSLEKSVYGPGETIALYGILTRGNISGSNATNMTAMAGASVLANITSAPFNGTQLSAYTLNTTAQGAFYSRSVTYPNATNITAPNTTGYYYFILSYTDPNSTSWPYWLSFSVVQTTVDELIVSASKGTYIAGEPMSIRAAASRTVGSAKIAQQNVSINGTIRTSAEAVQASFSCTTGDDGSCSINTTAPTTAGTYRAEANNYTSSTFFRVVPFDVLVYMKDSTGKAIKNTFKQSDIASVEAQVIYNGTTPTGAYTFNGTIADINGNTIKMINTTALNTNNSYVNRFSFTVDNSFANGFYIATVNVTGGSSTVSATTSFEVRGWTLVVEPSEENSNFEYGWNTFVSRNVSIDILPLYSANGTVITSANASAMSISVKDALGNALSTGAAVWNSTCRKTGCYRGSVQAPASAGTYPLTVKVDYNGEVQAVERLLGIIGTKVEATPTSEHGELKELFGTNEFIYITLEGKSQNGTATAITDAVLRSVTAANGSQLGYTNTSYENVNASNTAPEYGYNATSQRLRLDTPKAGGPYTIEILANNRTAGTTTSVVVNPYDVCIVAKNTPGNAGGTTGYYFVYQFKTDDVLYLELIVKEADNPLGKASSLNGTNSTAGTGLACKIDTTQEQAVTNATLTVVEVINLDTGTKESVNSTTTVCQADDTSGKYTCTIQQQDNKWNGGKHQVKLRIEKGGISDIAYGFFEARAFYLYAWSQNWRNKPNDTVMLNVNMYQAGSNWWRSSTGLSGTASVERVEFCGGQGYWMASCVDYGYNTTGLNASTVTNGQGTLNLSVNRTTAKKWGTGSYKVVIKGTDSAGTTDYGYAWFEVKNWEVWTPPVGVPGSGACNYKYSFGTKENVTLYVRISNAGEWNDAGGTSLGGNVSISVKKLQDTSSSPPKEINASTYTATSININRTTPHYWSSCNSSYVITISPTSGKWNDTGYFNAVIDVNGTETGFGWFQVKSFNVYTEPTNSNATGYVYSTNGKGPVYFKVFTTKGEKYYTEYTSTDFINATITDIILRRWDNTNYQATELNYPEQLNVSVVGKTTLQINGTNTLNVTRLSGNWSSGYYWGELTMKDAENQTGKGYLWFNVQPFRVETAVSQYEVGASSNATAALTIREPDWNTNALLPGNYTITSVYEDVWSMSGYSRTAYNYTPTATATFNGTATLVVLPPSGKWGSGSWGGYHYLTVVVRDNSDNTTQGGWMSFRTLPFKVTIGTVANVGLTGAPAIPVTLQDPVTNGSITGNITKVYRWTSSGQTTHTFSVGSCSSSASSYGCQINGSANVTVTAPTGGWEDSYVYLTLVFTDGTSTVESYANFRAAQAYSGWWSNIDENGQWKYYFNFTDNATLQLNPRDTNNAPVTVTVTNVEYAETPSNCWTDSCRTYVSANWSIVGNASGTATCAGSCFVRVKNPGVWQKGDHTVRASVNGSQGNATIKSGYFWVKDLTPPTLSMTSPVTGTTYTSSLSFSATTSESANCYLTLLNHDTFKNWFCSGNTTGACNSSAYNGTSYYYQYIGKDYSYISTNISAPGTSTTGSTGLSTGQTSHSYSFSMTSLTNQDYGLNINCYDEDWNSATGRIAFKINKSS